MKALNYFRLLPKIYLTFNSSNLFHCKTHVLKESYLKTASVCIIGIIYPEDPCPMEDLHVKRNPYSVCAKGTFEKVGESLQICRTTYAELESEKKAVPG